MSMKVREGATPRIPRELHASIPHDAFAEGRRPTLAVLVNHKDRLLLVNHAKAPRNEWTLPQEGVGQLETLCQTAIRGLREELGLVPAVNCLMGGSHSRFFEEDFFNPIPADRTPNGEKCVKNTVFFALRSKTDRISPNPNEIQATVWVSSWTEFLKYTVAHGERRPEKFKAIARVLVSSCVPQKDGRGISIENAFFDWGPPPNELVDFLHEPVAVA